MTTLNTDSGVVTLINTFTVAPDNVDDLLEVLSRATEQTMRRMPGFISANFHVADDRRHVANYAQWRSKADFEAQFGGMYRAFQFGAPPLTRGGPRACSASPGPFYRIAEGSIQSASMVSRASRLYGGKYGRSMSCHRRRPATDDHHGRAPALAMHRKPTWLVEVSTGSACRAAGR